VAFTRLCGFRIGAARDGYNPGFLSWLVVLVVLRSFWRLSVDGFVSGGGACSARAITGGGDSGRQLLCLSFSCVVCFYLPLDSLLCANINLVFGSRPECVTDSLFK
jgi:hypothetical protein